MAGFGGAVKLTGESEYRKALQQITQNLKEVSSKMKVVSSEYAKGDTSTEALNAKTQVLNKQLEQQTAKLNTLKKQYDSMGSAQQQQISKHEALVQKYNQEKTALDNMGKTLGTSSNEYKKQQSIVSSLQQEVTKSTNAIDSNEKSLSNLRVQMNNTEASINSTKNEMSSLSEATEETGNSAEKAESGFTVFKGTLANIASTAITTAVGKLKELAVNTIQAGSNFESAMSQVSAISGATGTDLEKLTDKAKEMGEKTKFSATNSANAFTYMAMAGWKTSDMLNGIEGVMNLAAASGEDLATTSDIVTDALTAMGYSAGDAGKLADVMAASSSNSNTNVAMMGQTFKYVAPIVGSLGYSMEDTATAIGLMANSGIKAEQAGTSLRSILTRLSAPPKECADAMDALGISMTNSDGTMKSLSDVMGELRSSFSGLSETQQTQYAKSIAGQEAMSGLLAIVNAAPSDYDKLSNAISNSNGAAQSMADTMQNNAQGSWTLLQSKIEGIQIALYEKLQPAIETAISILDKLADGFQWVVDHSTEITATLAAIAGGFAAFQTYSVVTQILTNGITSLTVVTKAQAAAQAILNAVMNANPIGILVTAIGALVAAFLYLWNTSDSFRGFWTGLWDNLTNIVSTAIEGIKGFFTGIIDFIQNNWQSLLLLIVNPFAGAFKLLYDNCEGFRTFINNFVEGIISFIKQLPQRIMSILNQVISNVISFGSNMAQKGKEAAVNLFNNIVNTIQELPSKMLNIGKNIVEGIWNGISNATDWIVRKVKGFAKNILNGIKDALGIHSPSRVMRDQVGKNMALGIGEGFTDEMANVSAQMQDAIPTDFDTNANINGITNGITNGSTIGSTNYYEMVNAFKDALGQMQITLDDEEMGRFIDKTVSNAIFN